MLELLGWRLPLPVPWCQKQTQRCMAENFHACKPSWYKACDLCISSTRLGTYQSLGLVKCENVNISLHAWFCLVVCSFARWIVVFNPWYNCRSNLFVSWQEWLLPSVGISWLLEAQEIMVVLSSACRLQARAFISLLQGHFVLPPGRTWTQQFTGQFAH